MSFFCLTQCFCCFYYITCNVNGPICADCEPPIMLAANQCQQPPRFFKGMCGMCLQILTLSSVKIYVFTVVCPQTNTNTNLPTRVRHHCTNLLQKLHGRDFLGHHSFVEIINLGLK